MAYMIAGPEGPLPNPEPDPPAVEFVTDEPLIHNADCRVPIAPHTIRLHYSQGRITCLACGAWVPGEVRPR